MNGFKDMQYEQKFDLNDECGMLKPGFHTQCEQKRSNFINDYSTDSDKAKACSQECFGGSEKTACE